MSFLSSGQNLGASGAGAGYGAGASYGAGAGYGAGASSFESSSYGAGAGAGLGLGAGGSSYESSSFQSSTGGLGGGYGASFGAGAGAGLAGGASSYESASYSGSAGYGADAGFAAGGAIGVGGSSYESASSSTQVQQYRTDAQGLFVDDNPQIIRRPAAGGVQTYTQNIRVRFLQPPPVPPPGVSNSDRCFGSVTSHVTFLCYSHSSSEKFAHLNHPHHHLFAFVNKLLLFLNHLHSSSVKDHQ